jgi:hypothetical protein
MPELGNTSENFQFTFQGVVRLTSPSALIYLARRSIGFARPSLKRGTGNKLKFIEFSGFFPLEKGFT